MWPRQSHSAGGCTRYPISCMNVVSYSYRPSLPYSAGMDQVEFLQTRQTLLALSAKRREVTVESREG